MIEWILGEPSQAGWYLVAVRTNDVAELYWVLQLWFNPNTHPKWWAGGGYMSNKGEPYHFQEGVTAHSEIPVFTNIQRQQLSQR